MEVLGQLIVTLYAITKRINEVKSSSQLVWYCFLIYKFDIFIFLGDIFIAAYRYDMILYSY